MLQARLKLIFNAKKEKEKKKQMLLTYFLVS